MLQFTGCAGFATGGSTIERASATDTFGTPIKPITARPQIALEKILSRRMVSSPNNPAQKLPDRS